MSIREKLRAEPIALIGLAVSVVIGLLSSPILIDWYTGADVKVTVLYTDALDGRCIPQRIWIVNEGSVPATNIRIQYRTDSYSLTEQIIGSYLGDAPQLGVTKQVPYTVQSSYVLVEKLAEGIEQQFVFEEEIKSGEAVRQRLAQIEREDPKILSFPALDMVTSDQGKLKIRSHRESNC